MRRSVLLMALVGLFGLQSMGAGDPLEEDLPGKLSVTPPAADMEITKSGFFFHLGGIFPSRVYMVAPGTSGSEIKDLDPDSKFRPGFHLEIGNMFRFVDKDPIAIGLKISWFEGQYVRMKIDSTGFTSARALQGGLLHLGPYFTYKLADDMAVDVSYQFGATHVTNIFYWKDFLDDKTNSIASSGLGVTHSINLGFRFQMLSLGLGYRFGTVRDYGGIGVQDPILKEDYKMRTNALRLFVGIKI